MAAIQPDVQTPALPGDNVPSPRRKGFFLRLIIFVLPFALPFLLLTGALVYVGESMPLAWVVQQQMGDAPVLYRPRFGNRDLAFKALSVNMRAPDVIALGSSRILQFRAGFFNRDPSAFYNAAVPALRLEHLRALLDDITATPDVIILAIDHPWFNDAYTGDPAAPIIGADNTDYAHLFNVNRSVMQTIISGETIDVGRMLARHEPGFGGRALGLRAIRDGHGFRNDGSEQYGDFLVARWLYPENERQRHLDWLRDGQEMYVRGDTISTGRLAALDDLLRACAERGIFVIGFSPPFMPTVWDQLVAGGQHGYITAQPAALSDLFAQYGFSYVDYSDGETLGANDNDFFDGWHASERIYLRLYIDMLQHLPERLAPYSDLAALQAIEASATDTFNVFGP